MTQDKHIAADAEQFSKGFDRGNYGNAYESGSWEEWSERNEIDEHDPDYREGMTLGFFSSYEIHEIDDEMLADHVLALRAKHGMIDPSDNIREAYDWLRANGFMSR